MLNNLHFIQIFVQCSFKTVHMCCMYWGMIFFFFKYVSILIISLQGNAMWLNAHFSIHLQDPIYLRKWDFQMFLYDTYFFFIWFIFTTSVNPHFIVWTKFLGVTLAVISVPCGLVARIPGSHPGGPGSIPGMGRGFNSKMSWCYDITSIICVMWGQTEAIE